MKGGNKNVIKSLYLHKTKYKMKSQLWRYFKRILMNFVNNFYTS